MDRKGTHAMYDSQTSFELRRSMFKVTVTPGGQRAVFINFRFYASDQTNWLVTDEL